MIISLLLIYLYGSKYLNNLTINNNNVLCYVHKNEQIDRGRLESKFYVSYYDETNASYYLPSYIIAMIERICLKEI